MKYFATEIQRLSSDPFRMPTLCYSNSVGTAFIQQAVKILANPFLCSQEVPTFSVPFTESGRRYTILRMQCMLLTSHCEEQRGGVKCRHLHQFMKSWCDGNTGIEHSVLRMIIIDHYAQGKTDTETIFIVTVGFTTNSSIIRQL